MVRCDGPRNYCINLVALFGLVVRSAHSTRPTGKGSYHLTRMVAILFRHSSTGRATLPTALLISPLLLVVFSLFSPSPWHPGSLFLSLTLIACRDSQTWPSLRTKRTQFASGSTNSNHCDAPNRPATLNIIHSPTDRKESEEREEKKKTPPI
ncbi:uncharacterized protein BO80DRAFT_275775 [Aspergillus ibericus CBS 121593]|uniref:Uncharacterized protein n=1 Tax=Aspergillus ibericus CBS 121593 TaxID=1448316 RepID=A0A395GIZ9_9EURO|nr:hypothetical protein BO80DRAFT_275775 [Aspergillus ibericus CBS 121593]RAK95252.1 hypothetical protein BO80DRAFT_275775 [Aspergillus ibericus CBS 121593]